MRKTRDSNVEALTGPDDLFCPETESVHLGRGETSDLNEACDVSFARDILETSTSSPSLFETVLTKMTPGHYHPVVRHSPNGSARIRTLIVLRFWLVSQ